MKISISYHGMKLEAERVPLSNERFRLACRLTACGLYVCLTLGLTALCGFRGVLTIAAATALVAALNAC